MARSASLRAELEVARAHGIPYSEFLSWDRYDQDLALALASVEAEEEANRCPVCGGDKSECQDPKNQRAYEAAFKRCYATRTVSRAMRAHAGDEDAKSRVAYLKFHPARVKP